MSAIISLSQSPYKIKVDAITCIGFEINRETAHNEGKAYDIIRLNDYSSNEADKYGDLVFRNINEALKYLVNYLSKKRITLVS